MDTQLLSSVSTLCTFFSVYPQISAFEFTSAKDVYFHHLYVVLRFLIYAQFGFTELDIFLHKTFATKFVLKDPAPFYSNV